MSRSTSVIRVLVCDRADRTFEEIDEAEIDDTQVSMVGWAQNADGFHRQLNSLRPDVLVVDLDNPGLDGLQELRQVFLNSLPVGVIAIFDQQDTQRVRSAMRLGVDDFLVRPVAPEALAGSIANVFGNVVSRYPEGWKEPEPVPVSSASKQGAGKLVAITSGKAGVGKTTIGTNLALALARETQRRVCLIDLDHGDSALLLDLHPDRALIEVAETVEKITEAELAGYYTTHNSGVTLIVGSNDPETRDLDTLSPDSLIYIFSLLRTQFDFVIVNFPVLGEEAELNLLLQANEVLCVTTARDLLDLRATRAFLGRLRQLDPGLQERLHIVANAVNMSRFIGEDELTKTLGFKLVVTVPQNEELAVSSVNAGNPFVVSAPNSPLAEAVVLLSRRVAGLPVQAEPRNSRGFFGLFRG